MKKLYLFAILAMVSTAGIAADTSVVPSGSPEMGGRGMGPGGRMFENLTDDQKTCMKECGFEIPEMPGKDGQQTPPVKGEMPTPPVKGEMPTPPTGTQPGKGEHSQMTDDQKTCIKACGVEMPTMPTTGTGDIPQGFDRGVESK